jgi:NAD(P)-dependent dehydrogenase (short-subunit alcohol dehydrogenase family)
MSQLNGKHVAVTGGGSGIGAAIAQHLAQLGANVTIMGRRLNALEAVAADTPNISCQTCDVTDEDSVASAFGSIAPVDILVNCAGAAPTSPFHKLSLSDWRAVMNLNLDGVFLCTQAVLPGMLERGFGRIVNIASTASLKGYAYVSAYCAAKHGVLGLTRALALETATKGVTVNAVCPGYTDTEIIRDSVKLIMQKTGRSEEEALRQFTATNPQQRLIQPQEVATTVAWLCDNGSESMTGQAIAVCGGEV